MNHDIACVERTARKEHKCMSCEWLAEFDDFSGFSFAEKRVLVTLLRKKGGMIQKGDKYMEYVGKFEGEIHKTRYHKAAHELCKKHDVYCYD